MFSRRHPYMFVLLTLTAMLSLTAVCISIVVAVALNRSARSEFISDPGGEKIGLVEIKGIITDAAETIEVLKRFRENESIKAIVLRLDTPGGVIGPSQEIYREVQKTVEKKRVVASMGAVAASGGYYIAAAANGIMANPGTITGSIGVIITYTNFRSLLDKIGLKPVVIKSGPYKDTGSPTRGMSEAEQHLLQRFVDQTHRQFVQAIADGRGMPPEAVETVADGRIFSGQEALDLGLIDRLGNMNDAVQWAGEMAGIRGKIATVTKRKEKFSLLRYLTESIAEELTGRLYPDDMAGGYLYRP